MCVNISTANVPGESEEADIAPAACFILWLEKQPLGSPLRTTVVVFSYNQLFQLPISRYMCLHPSKVSYCQRGEWKTG